MNTKLFKERYREQHCLHTQLYRESTTKKGKHQHLRLIFFFGRERAFSLNAFSMSKMDEKRFYLLRCKFRFFLRS